ncbi:major facilitator superfamily domain-containing protein [Aspergillus coremiiformis]|uniref:Major facilitator superfamily domain-containing protein n=1 Tax=Aspergillus coremiiformis TaxID=138285 RepID=A0A5N6ZH39_9EURO|nr:major facilitator superfamily domain-containing protein [Aspergillus coremiiformis]
MSTSDIADEKKGNAQHVESVANIVTIEDMQVFGLRAENVELHTSFSAEQKKTLLHKSDVRLVPMLAVLYLVSHLDRSNIGNAKTEGLMEDLGLSWYRTLPGCSSHVSCWASSSTSSLPSVSPYRIAENPKRGGGFPGAVYLCALWYMTKDLSYRVVTFFCIRALSGVFLGLLAAAIAQMVGVGGQEGWCWISRLEGLVTVVLGAMCFFLLLSPNKVRYLELQQFTKEGGLSPLKVVYAGSKLCQSAYVYRYFTILGGIVSTITMEFPGNRFTIPRITKAMGFTNTNAQIQTIPPYVARTTAVVFAKLSDRFLWQMPFIAIPLTLVAIAYSVVISFHGHLKESMGPSFFAVILISPSSRRAVGLAFNICIGNIGGIIGSYMFLEHEHPKYYTGFGLSLSFGVTGLIVALLLELSYPYGNQKKANVFEREIRERYSDHQALAMGDRAPLFKYTL